MNSRIQMCGVVYKLESLFDPQFMFWNRVSHKGLHENLFKTKLYFEVLLCSPEGPFINYVDKQGDGGGGLPNVYGTT